MFAAGLPKVNGKGLVWTTIEGEVVRRESGRRLRAYRLAAFLLVLPAAGRAQRAVPGDQETVAKLVEQIKELQQHDRELQERVTVLEGAKVSGLSASGKEEAVVQTPPPAPKVATSPAPQIASWHELHGIDWRGFGEVNYKVLDQRAPELGTYGFVPGSSGNFYTGDFDLLLTSRINDRTGVLSELVFEEGDAQSFKVNLGRMLLTYEFNDHLKLSFGRYHTAVGYYNTAFHHGQWLQTTVDRPLVMEFAQQGGMLPTQAVGLSAAGLVPSGELGLHYLAEYGSSDTIRPFVDGSGIQDENNGNHVNVGFYLRPDGLPGLQIGASYYHDRISDVARLRYSQTIVNAHIVYAGHGWEILNEGFLLRHAVLGSSTVFNNPAFYSQFSKRFRAVRPFFRYQ